MIDKIYYFFIKKIYYIFYSSKITLLDSNRKYDIGDVINDFSKKDLGIVFGRKQDFYCNWYEVIPSGFHISKNTFWETVILITLILLFLGFLIYIF